MKAIPAAMLGVIPIVITITMVFAAGQEFGGSTAGPVILPRDGGAGPSMILDIWEQDLSNVLENGDSIHGVEVCPFTDGTESFYREIKGMCVFLLFLH